MLLNLLINSKRIEINVENAVNILLNITVIGSIKKKYGISLDEYNEILASQNNECCICGTNDPGGPGSTFTVDHNHKTEEVRGLLCSNCNRGLGFFKDNPDHLFAATKYLIERGYYG